MKFECLEFGAHDGQNFKNILISTDACLFDVKVIEDEHFGGLTLVTSILFKMLVADL